MISRTALCVALILLVAPANAQEVMRATADQASLSPLPMRVVGRVEYAGSGRVLRQWPGTYFESAFKGRTAMFRVGPGDVSLRVSVDSMPAVSLVKPAPGLYQVANLTPGTHSIKVQVASESQAEPTEFGGFFASSHTQPAEVRAASRQIEFIGDSHTIGYGNLSAKRECTEAEVWSTTDTSRGIPSLTAARYGADYEVNAISGRGVVRNYNGGAGDTLPEAYPFTLFDKSEPVSDRGWHPQVVVIALGTNDFSTALQAGEKWHSRDQLHADYEATYARFLTELRRRYPNARLVLWATDASDGEIIAEVRKVAETLKGAGENRLDVVPVSGLALTGCNYHPSVADDVKIASALSAVIDLHPEVWGR